MDKRFFLALLLTGAVVVGTPMLFPRPQVARPAVADSTAVMTAPAAMGAAAAVTTAPAAASTTGSITTPTIAAAPGAEAAPIAAPPLVVDTVTLANGIGRYRFSSLGARLMDVELPRFERLGATKGAVKLEHGREAMLSYRLLTGGDTIALDRLAFTTTHDSAARSVRFSAPVGAGTLSFNYQLSAEDYLTAVKVEAAGLAQPAFLLADLPTGFTSQERDSTEDFNHLAYATKPEKAGAERVDFRSLDPGEREIVNGPLTWAVAKNKYFLVGLLTPVGGTPLGEVQVTGGARTSKVATRGAATVILPLASGALSLELYAGPQEWKRLVALGREFENSNPYGGFANGVVQPFATIVMRVLLWMKSTLRIEYGWILVIFGVTIRLAMWPLNSRMMRSSIAMQRLAPEIQAVQEKYAGDPAKKNEAVMKVYQEAGVSPFAALSGCLPMLLPMPILFALFFVFQNTIEFRGVSFLWLADISVKDPYYILPLLMGVSMYVLSWVGMRNVPPNPQTKMMSYLMPVIMTVALLNFASGLNLYYAVQNLAALPQQWLIANERSKVTKTAGSAVVKGPGTGGRSRKS